MRDEPHFLYDDESLDVDDLLLPDAVCAVHRLQILDRIPVVLNEDNRVRAVSVRPRPPTCVVSRR